MPAVVTDPEVPGPARRELAQLPLSALAAFSDPRPRPAARPGSDLADDARLAALPGKGLVAGDALERRS